MLTISGYFAPNSPWAPSFNACFSGSSSLTTFMASFIFLFTNASTFCFSSSVSFLSKLKSNLNRSEFMFEPRCLISFFRTLLRAAFSKWVAVWRRVVFSVSSASPDLNFPADAVLLKAWCFSNSF